MQIAESLKPLIIDIATVKLDPRNARKHPKPNLDAIKRSLEAYGQRKPIVVNSKTKQIEAGNGLYQAAWELGWSHIAAVFVEDDAKTAKGFALMDNQSALLADWDLPNLSDLLKELDAADFDMGLTGFSDEEIAKLTFTPNEGLTGDDEIPEQVETVCKKGDLWQLGKHRLLCGDSTKPEDVKRLMNGEKADMVFTDPPYGIGYEYESYKDNDNEKNAQLVKETFSLFACGKVWTCGLNNLARDVARFGKTYVVVWNKKFAQAGSGIGGASTWEPILVLDPTKRKLDNNVIEIMTDREPGLLAKHSCPKPVGLFVELIQSLSRGEGLITDPFGGSGSTLIACEKLNRRCFMMEISPEYTSVIKARWEAFTGKQAVLVSPATSVEKRKMAS